MRSSEFVLIALSFAALACGSGDTGASGGVPSTLGNGGSVSRGGGPTSGGSVTGSGGSVEFGGSALATSGGSVQGLGGSANTLASAGSSGSGGAALGGAVSGGAQTAGGKSGAGNASAGNTAMGGSLGRGGAPSAGGSGRACSRPVGVCTAPVAKVTEVSLGMPVTAYGREGDTDPMPMAIAAMPSGGSRVAVLGTDKQVYVAQLDCDDKLVGKPFSFPAVDLQDIYADDSGGVVLLTRDATNGGTDNCGAGTLCGGSSSPCRTMWMVRFDAAGNVTWETQVTNLGSGLAGYQNGARFVWWYQHHGRLSFDGTNYAAYFGVAITVNNGSCVDIHEGDRMQVVGPTGALLKGHDSFEVGCSHSWQSRIVWDPRSNHFAMVCATDNNCRIAQPNPYRTVASATCDGTFFGGDLVLSSSEGYWTAWSQSGSVRLSHFTTGAADATVTNAANSQHPHLVAYGADRMLLTWSSGSTVTGQVRSAGATGEAIGAPFTIEVVDHNFQAWKAYSDGSVAYPAAGTNNTSIKIARVLPCN